MAERPRPFLDASVLFAAAAAPEGGSALVLEICQAGLAEALVTGLVLREAERSLQRKRDEADLLRFYTLIAELDPKLVSTPSAVQIDEAAKVVALKDAHVLAGARAGKATHLVTLDRKHFLGKPERRAILPIIACTPGDFLQELGNV